MISKSTVSPHLLWLIKQENLVFILVILYIREYIYVFLQNCLWVTGVSTDFQLRESGSWNNRKHTALLSIIFNGTKLVHVSIILRKLLHLKCFQFIFNRENRNCYIKFTNRLLPNIFFSKTWASVSQVSFIIYFLKTTEFIYKSFHQVGAWFVTVSTVTSVNVPSIILDYD